MTHSSAPAADAPRVVLVTGPSGAGRSTAINALEDLGFEAIDNMPVSLIPRLLDGPALARPMALGIDVRNRDFSPDGLLALHARLTVVGGMQLELLYLDCAADVLVRRYSETRRRHPLAPDASPSSSSRPGSKASSRPCQAPGKSVSHRRICPPSRRSQVSSPKRKSLRTIPRD